MPNKTIAEREFEYEGGPEDDRIVAPMRPECREFLKETNRSSTMNILGTIQDPVSGLMLDVPECETFDLAHGVVIVSLPSWKWKKSEKRYDNWELLSESLRAVLNSLCTRPWILAYGWARWEREANSGIREGEEYDAWISRCELAESAAAQWARAGEVRNERVY